MSNLSQNLFSTPGVVSQHFSVRISPPNTPHGEVESAYFHMHKVPGSDVWALTGADPDTVLATHADPDALKALATEIMQEQGA